MTETLIIAFEVPPKADDMFIRTWERARDLSAAGIVHRALRADADFRFVTVASPDASEAWRGAVGDMPFTAHAALYEVVHEDGTPDGAEGVVLINFFEASADEDERFLADWRGTRESLAGRRGYLGTRLHRSAGPADFRFVDVARWSSPLAFSRAVGRPDWQAAVARSFRSRPALYQVFR